jgi:uncharacterized protein (TIGR02145 family)
MNKVVFSALLISILSYTSCRKINLPAVTTEAVTEISESSAKCGGDIISDGGGMITGRGVCWSTDHNPSIEDFTTSDGEGTGSFISYLTGLEQNTTYYVRAYAANSEGVAYGSEKSFTTQKLVYDVDGFAYHTIVIGNQTWLKENLKTTRYRDGSVIPLISSNSVWMNETTGAYCSYGNNNANVTFYGALYNWYTVIDNRKLCPEGWHIPTNEEWTTLTTYLGGLDIAGGKMKEAGLEHWYGPNTGADNQSGFTAFGSGFRDLTGVYAGIKELAYYWSSSEYSPTHGIGRKLFYDFSSVSFSGNYKQTGCAVRCIKDL